MSERVRSLLGRADKAIADRLASEPRPARTTCTGCGASFVADATKREWVGAGVAGHCGVCGSLLAPSEKGAQG